MRYLTLMVGVGLTSMHAGAASQLVAEGVDGNQRICRYGNTQPTTNQLSTAGLLRVGIAQNCPATYPLNDPNTPAPPTARLQSESIEGATRACLYEQWDRTWRFEIEAQRSCPQAAGMIEAPVPSETRASSAR
jgi:hypothetical protein